MSQCVDNITLNNTAKGRLYLVFTLMLLTICLIGQNSPFQLRIGYEQLYVSPKTTNGVAEKTWTWHVRDGDIFQMRTTLTQAYNLGIGYDITKWWNISLNFKKYYRRYYVWSGTYISKEHEELDRGRTAGQFHIVPFYARNLLWYNVPSTFHGTTLATTSWQIGTDFHHRISRDSKWQLHYYLSLNRDLYEVSLKEFDTRVRYGGEGWYKRVEDDQRIDYLIDGMLTLRSTNPGVTQFMPSTNIALAVSKKMRNGMGLRLEFGLRNIRWTKDNLLEENHWDLDMYFQQYVRDETNPEYKHVIYESYIRHEFPLYLGGYYTNLSFTFRPFRSPRDRDDYVPPGKKIKKFVKDIF